MSNFPPQSPLGPHRGAIDQMTITSQSPPDVMRRIKAVLENMGIEIQVESEYKYRCIRAKRQSGTAPASPDVGAGTGTSVMEDVSLTLLFIEIITSFS